MTATLTRGVATPTARVMITVSLQLGISCFDYLAELIPAVMISDAKQYQCFYYRGNDEQSRSQRMHIYATLLKQMAPEHLLATFAKVCAEILAAASDGMLSLEDATGQSVIQVAFTTPFLLKIELEPNSEF